MAFLLSYLSGLIFWWGIIYWLIHVTLAGTIILTLYLALYFGLFGLVVSSYSLKLKAYNLLFIPSLWVILEYARSYLLTGFPWALLGYSQYLNLPAIQISDITGAWGVSFLVMMINVLIYKVISDRLWVMGRRLLKYALLPVFLLFLSLAYGYYKLSLTPNTCYLTPIKVSVVQGNIPQELKWKEGSRDFILNKYLTLTSQASGDKPDLIVWPEASLPVVLEEEPSYYKKVEGFNKETNAPLLIGAVTAGDGQYYNSALLVSGNGNLSGKYDKIHLVPFGEYIPLRKTLGFLETIAPIGDITAGKDYTVFDAPAPFSVLICFEDLFPRLSRQFTKKGAGFLINITNDAWYKQTSAPYQHLQASVFRAVENRVYLVRAANTGVSAFIGPEGRIASTVRDKTGKDIFISGWATSKITLPEEKGLGLYTRYGDFFIAICFLIIFYGIILPFGKQKTI